MNKQETKRPLRALVVALAATTLGACSMIPAFERPASSHREELSISLSEDEGRTWMRPLAIARERVCGPRDDVEMRPVARSRLALADLTCRFDTVHLRHLHVHEDGVVLLTRDRVERLETGGDRLERVAE